DLGRTLLGAAWPIAQAIAARLAAVPGVEQVELAGSFRRRRDTVGDLDVLVTCRQSQPVVESFVADPAVAEVLGRGEAKSSVKLRRGRQVDVRGVPCDFFG